MEEDQIVLAGGYGLAALCMQMALLNALSGQGGVPVTVIDRVIERAKGPTGLIADAETTPGMIDAAKKAMGRLGENWKTMQVRHGIVPRLDDLSS